MRSSVSRGLVGRVLAKSLLTVAAAAMLSGCSNSIERFSSAYNNPSDADPVYTASVPKTKKLIKPKYVAQSYDDQPADEQISESPVARAPLNTAQKSYDYTQGYKKPIYKQPQTAYNKPKLKLQDEPVYDDSQDAAAAEEPIYKKPARKIQTSMTNGSAKVRVGEGMTMYSIAKANGVSVQELASANNMDAPYQLMVGQSLRIPGADTAALPATKPKKKFVQQADLEDEAPIAKSKKAGATHTVGNGETLYSLGRKYGVSPFVIADANGLSPKQNLSLGQKIRIPGAASQQTAQAEDALEEPTKKVKKAKLSLAEEEQQSADASDAETAIGEVPVAEAKPMAKQQAEQVAQAPTGPAGMNLRWPVKGKVISGFGVKPNGLKNEGINIAVPEGTSVRAADAGVVAYAGNELKGYGNLVLIRHPGGYVTAYAHAKELFVKRGDTVKRGDVIAKAGQSGAVSSPQLHFEVRKGATALDPMKFIVSSTAAN